MAKKVDFEAYFSVKGPDRTPFMSNVLTTFIQSIPTECHSHCTSSEFKHVDTNNDARTKAALSAYVEERLNAIADHECRAWINGQLPFITPRELQLWRLRMFVQYVWFWNLPDDEDLAMIFNLTKRQAGNLAGDFTARFRKTVIYPVALRRLYALINTAVPDKEKEKHPHGSANGSVYRVPSNRLVNAAQYLVDDIRLEHPTRQMASPYLWDKDTGRMWIDSVTIDIMKTDNALRIRFYDMYKIPEA
jgi:hypothetical protein